MLSLKHTIESIVEYNNDDILVCSKARPVVQEVGVTTEIIGASLQLISAI